jgi:hypothetical protein
VNKRNALNTKPIWILLVTLTVAAGLLLAGCESDPLREETETVALGDAASALVDITMGAGTLEVSGGADGLMQAEFVYNVDRWKPEVIYDLEGSQGILKVRQPVGLDINLGNNRYEWDLQFSRNVPMELRAKLGAGESTLDLKGLMLTRLEVNVGAGDLNLDLSGDRQGSFDARVRGGVGSVQILLPNDVGVKVDVTGGLGQVTALNLSREGGSYVNAAYGESPVTINLAVEGGIGQVDMEVLQ